MVQGRGESPIPPGTEAEETLPYRTEFARMKHRSILKRWSDAPQALSIVMGGPSFVLTGIRS